ncbi:MAG TPA: nitrogen fixation protein NifH [Anaerolineae bacterium]|nr:nitrogen fixation protein NifH [Anaerolineae bacterium]
MTPVDPLPWLLDPDNPSARSLALTQLLDRPADDPDVLAAQAAIPSRWPARAILDAQWPEGYWMRPGVGYSPKYKATVWQLIFLAALGARRTEVLDRAYAYVLEHSRLTDGRFSAHKTVQGAVICLNGNLLRAMRQLGFEDPRLEEITEVLAGMVVHDSFHCRFNAPKPLPVRMRDGLPCAWGAVKALGAFAEVPAEQRSLAVREAIEAGVQFLLSGDLADGSYPTATKPSPLWLKFGFPLGYSSDLLEALEVLGRLDAGRDPRLAAAAKIVRSKQDGTGRWVLEYTPGNTWTNFGIVGEPNKWLTLRALVALRDWE